MKIFSSKYLFSAFLVPISCLASFSTCAQQNDSLATAHADTTQFSPNRTGEWILFNSYLSTEPTDSVAFEVIVRHDRNSINWREDQYIGHIKTESIFPQQGQSISYFLLQDQYNIRIDIDGKCYLRLVDGNLPPYDPVTIPVQIKYYLH